MAAGCKNPSAVNFEPDANPDDYSCVYMLKNQDNCHWFEDVPLADLTGRSFTMSYAIKGAAWVFFHDYIPDMYIHTRERLFTAKSTTIYESNAGPAGTYYESVKPFFIDVIFQGDSSMILETVNWMTDYLENTTDKPFSTLTHITIWNSHQHTGKVSLQELPEFRADRVRKTKSQWVFKKFRNILLNKGVKFLENIFNDYLVISAQTKENQAWYKKELLNDKWFCVRFEFNNEEDVQVVLHDTTIQASKSDR